MLSASFLSPVKVTVSEKVAYSHLAQLLLASAPLCSSTTSLLQPNLVIYKYHVTIGTANMTLLQCYIVNVTNLVNSGLAQRQPQLVIYKYHVTIWTANMT